MNIDKLLCFLDLVETRNYTETAERLFTTQSNVSKQILSLEKELDAPLLDRSSRKLHLTPAGEALLPHARHLADDYAHLTEALRPFRRSAAPQLRICAIPVMAQYGVTALFARFHRQHPDIQLRIDETEAAVLIPELEAHRCDVIFTRSFALNDGQYEKLVLEQDQFIAVLPPEHPLAGQPSLSIAEMKAETFLQLDQHTQLLEPMLQLCREAGFSPHIGYTGTRMDNILDLVANGMGVSVMMRRAVESTAHGRVALVPIREGHASELAFVRLRSARPAPPCRLLWRFLAEQLTGTD